MYASFSEASVYRPYFFSSSVWLVAPLSDPFGHGSKSKSYPQWTSQSPVERFQQIGSDMGGEFTYQPKWDPKTVMTTTAIFFRCHRPVTSVRGRCVFFFCFFSGSRAASGRRIEVLPQIIRVRPLEPKNSARRPRKIASEVRVVKPTEPEKRDVVVWWMGYKDPR